MLAPSNPLPQAEHFAQWFQVGSPASLEGAGLTLLEPLPSCMLSRYTWVCGMGGFLNEVVSVLFVPFLVLLPADLDSEMKFYDRCTNQSYQFCLRILPTKLLARAMRIPE